MQSASPVLRGRDYSDIVLLPDHGDAVYCKPNAEQLAAISKLVDEGRLKAHVSIVLPLVEVKKAFQLSQSGRTRSKIVLQIGTSF